MESERILEWENTEWPEPLPFPRQFNGRTSVGVPLPRRVVIPDIFLSFRLLWRRRDSKIWTGLLPLARRTWEKRILGHFWDYQEYLREDSTAVFHQHIRRMRKRGGGTIAISGKKGEGKSWLAQMVALRILPDKTPVVIWDHRDIKNQVSDSDLEFCLLIDENLTATAQDSGNLIIHIENVRETLRKTKLFTISTGVSAKGGASVDLWLVPCGFNEKYQTTRAAMYDEEKRFLGFIALQRKHRPEDLVYYYNELGSWGEYEARATYYSRQVMKKGGSIGATDKERQRETKDRFKHYMQSQLDAGIWDTIPNYSELEYDYLELDFPADSSSFVKRVITKATAELSREARKRLLAPEPDKPIVKINPKSWDTLRELFRPFGDRFTKYYVPFTPKATAPEIIEKYGLEVLDDTFRVSVRREKTRITTTELGRAGEKFVAAHMEPLTPILGTGSKTTPDILAKISGKQVALNVKLSLEHHVRREHPTTPENEFMPYAFVVLVLPRLLEIRVFHITGSSTLINSSNGILTTPDTLTDTLVSVCEGVES